MAISTRSHRRSQVVEMNGFDTVEPDGLAQRPPQVVDIVGGCQRLAGRHDVGCIQQDAETTRLNVTQNAGQFGPRGSQFLALTGSIFEPYFTAMGQHDAERSDKLSLGGRAFALTMAAVKHYRLGA